MPSKKTPPAKTQVVTVPPPSLPSGADDLLTKAVTAGASVDTLERIMVLRKEMLAEQAKQAFNAAMAAFQAECPVIEKTKAVPTKSGKTAYKYAPIDSIVAQVKDLLQKHGFRYLVEMALTESGVKIICHVVHALGHEEVSSFEVPLGTKTEIMSQTQVVAAASTFAKRYAFLNAFGIMTGDEDTDTAELRGDQEEEEPKKEPEKKASPKEDELVVRRRQVHAVWAEFMKVKGIEDVHEIEAARHKAMEMVFAKRPTKVAHLNDMNLNELRIFIAEVQSWTKSLKSNAKVPRKSDPLPPPSDSPKDPPAPPAPTPQAADAVPTESDLDDYQVALAEQAKLEDLEDLWTDILVLKKKNQLKDRFVVLHQTYVKAKSRFKKID